jgi:SpoVK/Ycf46/Vps4 family AAA+-type ATPase
LVIASLCTGLTVVADQGERIFPSTGQYKYSHTTRTNNESDVFPHVSDQIVQDVLTYYPTIADKVKLLQNAPVGHKFLPDGLILVGAPGVSKTTIALAIARELNRKVAFFEATSLVGDQYQNSGVNYLQAKLGSIIKEIEESKDTQYVVIIDEITRLTEKFKNEQGEGKDISTKLWLTLDRFKESKRVFFIATANSLAKLPAPLRSRFANNILEIATPDEAYRKKILNNHLESHHNVKAEDMNKIIQRTAGVTHRDLTNIVMQAGEYALTRDSNNPIITYADIVKAYRENRCREQRSYKEQFVEWADDNKETIDAVTKVGVMILVVGGVATGGYYFIIAAKGGATVAIPIAKQALIAASIL